MCVERTGPLVSIERSLSKVHLALNPLGQLFTQTHSGRSTTAELHASEVAYRPDIDGLRGVAVLAVVIYHAFPGLLAGGFVGVDIFFVISGFLITSLVLTEIRQDRFSLVRFYARRVRRLFPALVTVLAATLAMGWYLMLGTAFSSLGRHAAATTAFVTNVALWRESGYFDGSAALKPLLHLWSLGVEEQFYLVWPLLLVSSTALRLRPRVTILVLALASLGASLATMRVDAAAAFYLPHARAWELMIGAALATTATSGRTDRAHWFQVSAIAGLAVTVASFVVITDARPFPGWWPALPVAGAALVIASGPRRWANRCVLSQRWLVGVGLVSYPLYLWHWSLLVFARIAKLQPSFWLRAGLVALSFTLSYATYRFIEQPVRAGRWKRNRWTVAVLAAASICVSLISLAAATGRLVTRTDARLGLITRPYDYRNAYRGKRCQLGESQRPRDFDPTCVDDGFGRAEVRSLMIWGDSHAAHLYPGLRALAARDRLALAQFTADGCAPVTVEDTPPYCRTLNDFVVSQLTRLRPDVVILSADWTDVRAASIPATLARVRAETDAPVVVIGPVPAWNPDLPTSVAVFARLHPVRGVPERLLDGLHAARAKLDAQMRDELASTGVRYVSPMSVLCTADGCLAVRDGRLIAWDATHLTDVGSSIVAREIVRQLPAKR